MLHVALIVLLQACKRSAVRSLASSVFCRKTTGEFQRLNGFNEPQFYASGSCWVSGMKLMIMCPAECH